MTTATSPLHSDSDDSPESSHSQPAHSSVSHLGLSFALYLTTAGALNRELVKKLRKAEDELDQMRSRRKEDAKANARVVEIFASHRHSWQQEERRLHRQIHESAAEAAGLRSKVAEMEESEIRLKEMVEELRRDLSERTELVEFMSMRIGDGEIKDLGFQKFRVSQEEEEEVEGLGFCVEENGGGIERNEFEFNPELLGSAASKFWSERAHLWQV